LVTDIGRQQIERMRTIVVDQREMVPKCFGGGMIGVAQRRALLGETKESWGRRKVCSALSEEKYKSVCIALKASQSTVARGSFRRCLMCFILNRTNYFKPL
jgi:hypothetical protein